MWPSHSNLQWTETEPERCKSQKRLPPSAERVTSGEPWKMAEAISAHSSWLKHTLERCSSSQSCQSSSTRDPEINWIEGLKVTFPQLYAQTEEERANCTSELLDQMLCGPGSPHAWCLRPHKITPSGEQTHIFELVSWGGGIQASMSAEMGSVNACRLP